MAAARRRSKTREEAEGRAKGQQEDARNDMGLGRMEVNRFHSVRASEHLPLTTRARGRRGERELERGDDERDGERREAHVDI
jgi:hypothetical protein